MQQTMKIWGSLALKKEEGRWREGLIRWSQEPPLFSLWTATCGGAFTDLLIAPALVRPRFCQPRNSLATINSWWSPLLIISQFYYLLDVYRIVERSFDGLSVCWVFLFVCVFWKQDSRASLWCAPPSGKKFFSHRSQFPLLLNLFSFLGFIVNIEHVREHI